MKKEPLPTLEADERYAAASRALAEADHTAAWKAYRSLDEELGKMGPGAGHGRFDLEDRLEKARSQIRDATAVVASRREEEERIR